MWHKFVLKEKNEIEKVFYIFLYKNSFPYFTFLFFSVLAFVLDAYLHLKKISSLLHLQKMK